MQQDQAVPELQADTASSDTELLPLFKRLRLSLARNYYNLANVFDFKSLQNYFQGSTLLFAQGEDVWILGEDYRIPHEADDKSLYEQAMSLLLMNLASRLWMSYRKGFAPLGPSALTSDAGWGCTLRSGQMLLAQVLLQHIHGKRWRRHSMQTTPEHYTEVAELLSWFWDSPAKEHPFSLHNLVIGGKREGIVAGEWLGPWTLCHTLHRVVNHSQPSGLRVHLANTPGGSAPVLYTSSVEVLFGPSDDDKDGQAISHVQHGLLLLVPLVLGIEKVNPRYIPQLQSLLTWPQSAGIVGGRPSSSLYFLGFQGQQIIYLDPHEVQEAGASPKDVVPTYFNSRPRMMQFASIDPSLALAFYCRSLDSFRDLVSRLQMLEAKSEGAPILNIVIGSPPAADSVERCLSVDADTVKGEEPWELLS